MSHHQPELGYVYFWTDQTNFYFVSLLGDKAPGPSPASKAYGGWERVKRKRRRALTEWPGSEPLMLDIPILIDGFAVDRSVEHEIAELEHMGGRGPSSHDGEPPLIHFNSGGVVPHDYHTDPNTDWVIDDIQWGDSNRRADGVRVRQAATIVVCEYIEDDSLANLTSAQRKAKAKAKHNQKKGSGAKKANQPRWVVRNGETLESIAASQLGKASRWHDLKALNPSIRDPRKPIAAGTIINLP